jgi:hypothetical protein
LEGVVPIIKIFVVGGIVSMETIPPQRHKPNNKLGFLEHRHTFEGKERGGAHMRITLGQIKTPKTLST